MMKSLTLLLLLFTFVFVAHATDYSVTSNAETGPGTLADAITQAGNNPGGAPNRILFNLPDQSEAGRTILINDRLPNLSSNLIIDATSQPGAAFGPTGAKVIITNKYSWQYANYFYFNAVHDVEIYGFWLKGSLGDFALHFKSSHRIVFGKPGKGNLVNGFYTGILCDNNLNEPGSSDVTIQGNYFGTDQTGMIIDFMGSNFHLENVANLQIGGLQPGEGNLLVNFLSPGEIKYTNLEDYGFLRIESNLQGTDITGTKKLSGGFYSWMIDGYNDGQGTKTNGLSAVTISLINNVGVGGFSFFSIANPITIQGNHLGVGLDGVTNLVGPYMNGGGALYLLFFQHCTSALVGGQNPGDMNWLAYNASAITEWYCGNITISRNSIFCNGGGIGMSNSGSSVAFANINILNPGLVGGKANPNALIELFYDDLCPGCQGKTFIGTTMADNNGNWSYAIAATGAIVVTATLPNGATSSFSEATINTDKMVVKDASCGRKNGSIKNLQVASGTEWYWKDAAGNIVGNNVDLENVGPSTYTFTASIGGYSCDAKTTPYTIKNVDLPPFDPTKVTITQPSCGQSNGAFNYTGTFNAAANYTWLLGSDTVLADFSKTNPFKGLKPGNYRLVVSLKADTSCRVFYDVFQLVNQTGPTLATNNVALNNATCGKSNGSVTGITYQNAIAPIYIAWKDASGKVVGNKMNLTGVPAGSYRLVFKDGGGCDTIRTGSFDLGDYGTIILDSSKMVVKASGCELPNGSISGLLAQDASVFTWKETASGNTVGNALDVANLQGGTYLLASTNSLGCVTICKPITIAAIPKPAFNYTTLQILNDTCNSKLGAVVGLAAMDKSLNYTWAWYAADGNGSPVGNSISNSPAGLTGMGTGNYIATITDPSQCSSSSKLFTIVNISPNLASPQVSDQFIPRNTSTTINVDHPGTGVYQLFTSNSPAAVPIDGNPAGILKTQILGNDQPFYVQLSRGDCSSPLAPVNIKVFDSTVVYAPNSFSPNNDGVNDRWHIVVKGLTRQIHIAIYNRLGVQVYVSSDPAGSWDGRYKGQEVSGGFVYVINGVDYFNKSFKVRGSLVLLR